MRLGLLTNSLTHVGWDLDRIAAWASENGIKYLEVGPTVPLDMNLFENVQSRYGVSICGLIYCRNFLSDDPEEAELHRKNIRQRIKVAGQLGKDTVVIMSTGRPQGVDVTTGLKRGLEPVVVFVEEMVELADQHSVRIAIENCPVMGNIAVSPYMYELLFERISNDRLGWAYDPSHLFFQFCDVSQPIAAFGDRIYHFHAVDTFIDEKLLAKVGTMAEQCWWHYSLPGKGQIQWDRLLGELKKSGYSGVISIEHEDPEWSGTADKITQGILASKEYLESLVE